MVRVRVKNKPKNDKAVKTMIKTNFNLKNNKGSRKLMVRVRVSFILFYSELAPTDP